MKSSEVKSMPRKEPEMNPSLSERDERIRQRAYELYEQHKRGDGYEVDDWLEAEAELRSQEKLDAKAAAA